MGSTADRTDADLWERVKRRITRGSKGGRSGQWSARKAQLATQAYKREGGGYKGRRSSNNSLTEWTREDWGTQSGRRSAESGERYLPKEARQALSAADYGRTTAKKRRDTQAGRQYSNQPKDVARKTARYRDTGKSGDTGKNGATKADLMAEARRRGLRRRSRMDKAELAHALGR